jgi:hypothetical protein
VLSPEPPTGSGWIHEIKHDGFRTLIGLSGKDARAFTRSGLKWAIAQTLIQRSDLNPARISSTKSFGCSHAAKCPPLSSWL